MSRNDAPDLPLPKADDGPASVCVVVTTYNHARFLAQALDSILAQTRQPNEIIVIDDGSTDDPGAVTARYPGVRLIRQKNQGLSAARNTGLAATQSETVVFLDADDRLLPRALEFGLRCLALSPRAAFAFGGHRRIDAEGRPLGGDRPAPSRLAYADLLRANRIAMHGVVTYRRNSLLAIGGFDTALRACEDYDVYLRLARDHPLATFPNTAAEYRQHGANMSRNAADMLSWVLKVHDRQRPYVAEDPALAAAWDAGRLQWADFYGELMPRSFGQRLGRKILSLLPRPSRDFPRRRVPWGQIRLGDLDRQSPISDESGRDRGTPIDVGYIAGFLDRQSRDIAGHILEDHDDVYSRRFGGLQISRQDVLHASPTAPGATIVGDLSSPGVLMPDAFDCIILTQTLQHTFDIAAAVRELHRGLKPGGVALVALPAVSRLEPADDDRRPYWAPTQAAATRLFAEAFGAANIAVETHGNVFAATAFLQGVAVEELDGDKLAQADPCFPVVITVRARKAA